MLSKISQSLGTLRSLANIVQQCLWRIDGWGEETQMRQIFITHFNDIRVAHLGSRRLPISVRPHTHRGADLGAHVDIQRADHFIVGPRIAAQP